MTSISVGPHHRRRHHLGGVRVALPLYIAVEDVRQFHTWKLRRGEHARNRTAHRAKPKQSDFYDWTGLRLFDCGLLLLLRCHILVVDSAGLSAPCIKA